MLYLPSEADWQQRCLSLAGAGFTRVTSFNPYWAENGATFQDKDGYRTVLQHGTWRL